MAKTARVNISNVKAEFGYVQYQLTYLRVYVAEKKYLGLSVKGEKTVLKQHEKMQNIL